MEYSLGHNTSVMFRTMETGRVAWDVAWFMPHDIIIPSLTWQQGGKES